MEDDEIYRKPQVDLSKLLSVPAVFAPLWQSPKRKNILPGGRGSAKSHCVARYLLFRALKQKTLILCTRELQNTIADSVHSLLSSIIENAGLRDYFRVTRDRITAKNGSRFIFTGVHNNVNEIKSMEGVDICWIEEAQAMSQFSLDVLVPTIRKPGSILIFTYNPFKDDDPVHVMAEKAIADNDPDTLVIKSNWRDNPFFPEVLRKEMEHDKATDYDKYLWVWEGECRGFSDALIFKDKYEVKEFTTPELATFYFGADWGFSVDPTTLVRCFVLGDSLYIDYTAGEVHCETEDIHTLFDKVPESRKHPIRADNARPETISAVVKQGFYCVAADKKPGSIEDGISFLRSFKKIYIHPRNVEMIDEFGRYQYRVDRQTGEVLREPLDKYNHYMDALRYALQNYMYGHNSGRVYSNFDLDSIVPFGITAGIPLYVMTANLSGKGFALAVQRGTHDSLLIVWAREYDGLADLRKVSADLEKACDYHAMTVGWLPAEISSDVPSYTIATAESLGWEPSIMAVAPNGDDATILVNRLFEQKKLYVSRNASLVITALNERTFKTSAAVLENTKEQLNDMFVRYAMAVDLLVWRLYSIFY